MRTDTYWGIASGKILLPYTIRSTKKQAIQDFVKKNRFWRAPEALQPTWENLKKGGHRVVKVTAAWENDTK